jgi:hypothetical protein
MAEEIKPPQERKRAGVRIEALEVSIGDNTAS